MIIGVKRIISELQSYCILDLDEEQMNDIILSMVEKKTTAGEVIINEGEDGDNFYVIETGTYSAHKEGEHIFTYNDKGSFGELALMYNCPRAATIKVFGSWFAALCVILYYVLETEIALPHRFTVNFAEFVN